MDSKSIFSSPKGLGTAIRESRKKGRLTQAELAFAAGVGIRFVSELEAGKPTAQIGKIMQVLAALGGRLTVRWNDDSP